MAKLSLKLVEHIAKLARLTLNPSEATLYQDQLSRVLEYVEQLGKVNTKNISPTYQVIDNLTNITRPDQTTSSLTQAQALSGAKKTHNGHIVTQAILDIWT